MGIPGLGIDPILTLKTEKDFLVIGMTGHEHLGRMFEYTLALAGTLDMLGDPAFIDIHALMGTQATLKMKVGADERYFDGYVTRMARAEMRGRYQTYTMTVRPWLWFATQTKDSYVFQGQSVKDIITTCLTTYSSNFDWRLDDESVYTSLDYCVQYGETDFDFVSRLMEEVGIYYFFEHAEGKHTMVLIDKMAKHKSRGDTSAINWANAMQAAATVTDWHVQEDARSVKSSLSEYDYLAPSTLVEGDNEPDPPTPPSAGGLMGAVSSLMGAAGAGGWTTLGPAEWYEHPALVVQNSASPDPQTTGADAAKQRAAVRMDELMSLYSSVAGKTNARDLGTGMTFTLKGTPVSSDEQDYLMAAAFYQLDFSDLESIADFKDASHRHEGYRCDFVGLSTTAPTYRMPRVTHKPVVAGVQTAIVVGSSGNEIETDKYGRIKVQFFWDRIGSNDEKSSCWVRVAQPWAGAGYGMFSLPRVGHEVVVQFVDGDPDRPLVTGSVYNHDNTVAWKLPDHSTFSGIKTQSSKGGTADNANELRFEDKKDSEYIWLNAEKDFYRIVENDAFDHIGNNENVKVVLTRKEVIGENWFMDITKDVMHNMGKDLHVNVAGDIFYTGGATFQLKLTKDFNAQMDGDLGIDVGGKTQLKAQQDIVIQSVKGKVSLKSGDTPTTGSDVMIQGGTISIKGASIVLEATSAITLKVGGSVVNVGTSSVDIVGPMVNINSGGGGGSATDAPKASPDAPTAAKNEDSIAAPESDDYEELFKDPTADDQPD